MPRRDLKKSKTEGLYKRCEHLSWDRCDCPWWGRVKRQRVSLEKWSGSPIRSKEAAKAVLARMEAAVLGGTFTKRGERRTSTSQTLGEFLRDVYSKEHKSTQKTGECSESVRSYVDVFDAEFGKENLLQLSTDPDRFTSWLKQRGEEKKWENGSYNRYVAYGKAIFNKARKKGLVSENPFTGIMPRDENNKRDLRISPEQEQRLLDACDHLDTSTPSKLVKVTSEQVSAIRQRAEAGELQKDLAVEFEISRPLVCQIVNGQVRKPPQTTMGPEMRRRIIGGIDLGLREGEMLKLQVKHINYDTWTVNLPKTITKAKKDQQLYAMTPRLQAVLEERRALGPDAYIFGRDSGRYVASFDKTWKRLFALAGLPTGRKTGYVWHDLRHEYGSYLADQDVKIHELKELMRHQDIRTTAQYLAARDDRKRELASRMANRHATA